MNAPKIHKLFGVYFAKNPWGNCFSPAVVLKTSGPASNAALTLRWNGAETTFYWRGGFRFGWNSAHLARRLGKFHDTDFGGYYSWRGHMDL